MEAIAAVESDAGGGTKRFRAKRDAILAAAAEAINEQSAKGMTFADVARRVGLNTTSVTYYFKRKEDLAAAAFDHTLDYLFAMLDDAAQAATPEERVRRYLSLNMARLARIERGDERAFAVLSDLRATEEPVRSRLMARWRDVFRRTRALWGDAPTRSHTALFGARAHVLLENTFWLQAWLSRYDPEQYPRVEARLMDVLAGGIAAPGDRWAPTMLDLAHDEAEPGRAAFLLAATRLINELGYRGTSVQRIAAELNVTKGSFYHHLDAKDDLVLECFRQSYRRVSRAQHLADEAGGTHWQRISTAIAMLLDVQFGGTWPLLRTTALHALPADVRVLVVERSNRMALRFAGMLVDGIGEGSIRPIDPMIASQIVMATLNAAYDLRHWAQRLPRAKAVAMYASTLTTGLFD